MNNLFKIYKNKSTFKQIKIPKHYYYSEEYEKEQMLKQNLHYTQNNDLMQLEKNLKEHIDNRYYELNRYLQNNIVDKFTQLNSDVNSLKIQSNNISLNKINDNGCKTTYKTNIHTCTTSNKSGCTNKCSK